MQIGEPTSLPPAEQTSEKTLAGNFAEQKLHCGDEATLNAQSTNFSEGASAKFVVKYIQDDSEVGRVEAPIKGQAARARWTTKAPVDKWQIPTFRFDVSGEGLTSRGKNELTLLHYEKIAATTKTINCTSGIYGWKGAFDISMEDGVITVLTRIKLLNRNGAKPQAAKDKMPDVKDVVSDKDKADMKADIEGKLSGKHLFHREKCARKKDCDCPTGRACCKMTLRVVVEFVESGEHHRVDLFQGAGRANATQWTRVKTRANSWAHETGHLLGWYDEYATGAIGSAPRWQPERLDGVMNSGLTVPEEYYWDFRDWFAGKSREKWELKAP